MSNTDSTSVTTLPCIHIINIKDEVKVLMAKYVRQRTGRPLADLIFEAETDLFDLFQQRRSLFWLTYRNSGGNWNIECRRTGCAEENLNIVTNFNVDSFFLAN